MLKINDELNVQLENQVLPELRRHSKAVKLSSIKGQNFIGELSGMV